MTSTTSKPTLAGINDQLKKMNEIADTFKEMLATLTISINTIVKQSTAEAERLFTESLTSPLDTAFIADDSDQMLEELEAFEAITATVPEPRPALAPLSPMRSQKECVRVPGANQQSSLSGHTDFG
jgi:hypothetical protein